MITIKTITQLSDSKKILLFVSITMAFCILNCLSLRACEHVIGNTTPGAEKIINSPKLIIPFDALIEEAELKLQSWMLDFNQNTTADIRKPVVREKNGRLKAIKNKPASGITMENKQPIVVSIM